jgi:ribosome maturation protein Sdo1
MATIALIIWEKGKLQILAQRRRDAEMEKKKEIQRLARKPCASAPLRGIFLDRAF